MKTFLNLSFLMGILISWSPGVAGSDDFLTQDQAKRIVKEIDDVCGDVWCEGEFGFEFHKFSCNKQTQSCRLDFTMIGGDEVRHEVFCDFYQVTSYGDLLRNNSGNHFVMTRKFYKEVNECINKLEEGLSDSSRAPALL